MEIAGEEHSAGIAPGQAPPFDPLAVEGRNLLILATQSVVTRVGWIFKTESVIMPAFLDAISGAGWMRGFLPILSRAGQSIPPLVFADHLRGLPLKKRSLVFTTFQMAWPFLLLAWIWGSLHEKRQPWLPPLFLLLYTLFFGATGTNQLAFGTLEGKLIRPRRRGLLMSIGGIVGSILSVTAAVLWLRPWLALPNHEGFKYIFLFNGLTFLFAGVASQFCAENPDERRPARLDFITPFRDAYAVYRGDRAFRRAARVAMLFTSSILLFPHYQWLGQNRLGSTSHDLFIWVVAQNVAVGLFSPLLGTLADRFGNRLSARVAVFGASLTPLVAIGMARGWFSRPDRWYWVTFAFLGLTPVTMKTFLNYTLELADQSDHPRYQSTMTLCFAAPFVFSPLVGLAVDWLPFELPFLFVSGLIAAGGILTFWMSEPRGELN